MSCKIPIDKLLETIKTEGLTIIGNRGSGKTNALMILVSSMKNTIPIVVDYASQHCYTLGSEFAVKFMNENYLIRKPHIEITKPIILDFSQTNKATAGKILRDLIKREYYNRTKQVIEDYKNGATQRNVKGLWQIWCIEEAQDLIGRYLKQDDDLKTAIAVGRNYNISFCFLTQRLADLNTQLCERTAIMTSKLTGDNNLRKLSSALGIPRKKLKFIETLDRGEFIFYNGKNLERIKFPKFEGFGRAYDIERELVMRKPKKLFEQFKEALASKPQEKKPSKVRLFLSVLKDIFLIPSIPKQPKAKGKIKTQERIEYPEEQDYPDSTDADLMEFGLDKEDK